MKAPPSRPDHFSKAPPLNTITLGVSLQHTNFGGGHIHSIKKNILLFKKLLWGEDSRKWSRWNLLSPPFMTHKNYNWNTWRTIWRLAEQKSYNYGFTKEATLRLVGRVEMWKVLDLYPCAMIENREGYLSCRCCLWGARGVNPILDSLAQNTRIRKRSPYNIWQWKSAGIPSTLLRQKVAGTIGVLLKGQYANCCSQSIIVGSGTGTAAQGSQSNRGENGLCGFKARARGTAPNDPVLSLPTAWPMGAIFPGLKTIPTGH